MVKISDCGEDGCGECDVCRYLDHLEHAVSVGGGSPDCVFFVERNAGIEEHLDQKYPNWRL